MSVLAACFSCCRRIRKSRDAEAGPDEETRLIPESQDSPAVPNVIVVDHEALKSRLGGIVRAKQRRMVNVGTPLPFHLAAPSPVHSQPSSPSPSASPSPSPAMRNSTSSLARSTSSLHRLNLDPHAREDGVGGGGVMPAAEDAGPGGLLRTPALRVRLVSRSGRSQSPTTAPGEVERGRKRSKDDEDGAAAGEEQPQTHKDEVDEETDPRTPRPSAAVPPSIFASPQPTTPTSPASPAPSSPDPKADQPAFVITPVGQVARSWGD